MTGAPKGSDRRPPDDLLGRKGRLTLVERVYLVLSATALLVLLVLVALDIVTRGAFNFSFEISDEVGGYMLVALAFLSLAVCYASGSFHQVEVVQERLSWRGRILSALIFDSLVLGVAALFLWQSVRLVMSSWRYGDVAPTLLATPLWLPRTVMALGMAGLCYAALRGLIADVRALRAALANGGNRHER